MKILLSIGSALVGGALMFQMPAKPPMKMGLWESTTTTKVTGTEMPQGTATPSMTFKGRSCMTPESYARNLGGQRQKDCTRTNEVWAAKTYTFDISCKNGSTGHFAMTFDSLETGHAVIHMNMNSKSGHPIQADTTTQSHFVSANCGNVKPD